jgi:hypothetical protein
MTDYDFDFDYDYEYDYDYDYDCDYDYDYDYVSIRVLHNRISASWNQILLDSNIIGSPFCYL